MSGKRISGRTRLAIALAAAVATAAASAAALAVIPSSNGTIHGCYEKRTGLLRVLDAEGGKSCLGFETAISWSQRGPAGPAGVQGPRGENGPAGAPGLAGPEGPAGAAGPPGHPGAGLVWRGTYAPSRTYAEDDAVENGGSSYVATRTVPSDCGALACESTNAPPHELYWELLAARGLEGAEGQQGATGAPGAQGAAGTTGPAGPAGPQGPQGPSGPPGSAASGRIVVTESSPNDSSGGKFSTATCPNGKVLVGGGYTINNGPVQLLRVIASAPELSSQAWSVSAIRDAASTANWSIAAWAICVTG